LYIEEKRKVTINFVSTFSQKMGCTVASRLIKNQYMCNWLTYISSPFSFASLGHPSFAKIIVGCPRAKKRFYLAVMVHLTEIFARSLASLSPKNQIEGYGDIHKEISHTHTKVSEQENQRLLSEITTAGSALPFVGFNVH
jgi:hypothetical protein